MNKELILEERLLKICRIRLKKKSEGLERFVKYLGENRDN